MLGVEHGTGDRGLATTAPFFKYNDACHISCLLYLFHFLLLDPYMYSLIARCGLPHSRYTPNVVEPASLLTKYVLSLLGDIVVLVFLCCFFSSNLYHTLYGFPRRMRRSGFMILL